MEILGKKMGPEKKCSLFKGPLSLIGIDILGPVTANYHCIYMHIYLFTVYIYILIIIAFFGCNYQDDWLLWLWLWLLLLLLLLLFFFDCDCDCRVMKFQLYLDFSWGGQQ